ncbi:TRAP transporter substrate-binding protein [Halomonas organivorans]|uniref:Tripartite ATP-independent transporter DctP family solute receptor n=1 Tax=Halomonas organivorans TaxID=257772 RepID=A0A7W5G8F0_9GAMM|nr:TRAP transporter substrate-binding protein [Halomonas organivorans]MBB3143511.1 tripartite ATP-independent transporter DctP family solute receptor [Halomonas organivorans]
MIKKWIDPKNVSRNLFIGTIFTVGLGVAGTAQAIDLRFGHGGTEDTAYQLGAEKFQELLTEKTDGELGVQIMGNSVLGHETEMFEQQMAGALDLSIINPGLITDFSPTANVFSIPFLYRDVEHWQAVLDGEVGREIADRITDETGVRVLAFFGGGKRQIVSSKPLESLDDLEGMKLRTNPTKPLITAWSALGAEPTVMAWKEIYTGLQLGAIDGLLNEAEWILRMRFHEVAPHIGLSQHDITVRLLTMSQPSWERLDGDQQQAVMAAAQEAAGYARQVQLEQDAAALDQLVEEGATLHELDRERMQAIVEAPLSEVIEEMGLTELHDKIINVGKS